jgi:hypothetical protein
MLIGGTMVRHARGLFLAAVAIAACQGEPTAPSPTFARAPAPANPEIAFSNSGLWVMDRDGSNAVQVTPRGRFYNPSWSPLNYGNVSAPVYRIAYDAGEAPPFGWVEVRIVNGKASGGTPTTLVADGRLPAWSPKGDEIAYIRGDTAIWVVKIDGSGAYEVAERDTAAIFTRVTWNPDASRLAWIEDAENYSGNPIRTIKSATRSGPGSTIWSSATALYVVGRTPGGLSSLTWANKGDSLLFAFGDTHKVALLDITGAPRVDTLFQGSRPVWSPDDAAILFVVPGVAPKLATYSFSTGTTSVVSNKNDTGRPDWRR